MTTYDILVSTAVAYLLAFALVVKCEGLGANLLLKFTPAIIGGWLGMLAFGKWMGWPI